MKKPIIAIIPLYDREKNSYWMLPGYMQGIEQAGGIGVMLPLTHDEKTLHQLAAAFDGFLFTGGQDVSPELYHVSDKDKCEELCVERDQMESILLKAVIALDKPVLGICRGIQMLNSIQGGTLYQDLPQDHPSSTSHRMKAPYDRAEHFVDVVKKSLLDDILATDHFGVNSCHHQAIKTLGQDLKAAAVSEDGLIESVYMPQRHFVLAVQWHPEFFINDIHSQKIFKALIDHCQK